MVGLCTPDTPCCPHQDIGVQDIVRGNIGTFVRTQDVPESGTYPVEQGAWYIFQGTESFFTPSHRLFAVLYGTPSQGLKSQLRVRLVDSVLQHRAHNAIDFTYFGQNVEGLDAQAMPAHLAVVCCVQERSRGWREYTAGPAPQQASGTPVTVPPAWLPLCQ